MRTTSVDEGWPGRPVALFAGEVWRQVARGTMFEFGACVASPPAQGWIITDPSGIELPLSFLGDSSDRHDRFLIECARLRMAGAAAVHARGFWVAGRLRP